MLPPLIVSKDYPDALKLLSQFNAELKTIRADGTYDRILEKYRVRQERPSGQ